MNYLPTETFPKIITLPENIPPARIHVHKTGYAEVFGGNESKIKEYIEETLIKKNHLFRNSSTLIGISWADPSTQRKTLDLFGYSKEKSWQENPEIRSWVISDNNILIPAPISCGEGIIRLGKELEYRKTTKTIEEYLADFPEQFCIP